MPGHTNLVPVQQQELYRQVSEQPLGDGPKTSHDVSITNAEESHKAIQYSCLNTTQSHFTENTADLGQEEKVTWKDFSEGSGWDFPGGPVVKTLCSQCRGPGFDPQSLIRELDPTGKFPQRTRSHN